MLTKLSCIAVLLVVLPAAPAAAADDPLHVVMDYVASWNMHDPARAANDLAYDVRYFAPTAGTADSGRDAVRVDVGKIFIGAVPDAVWMLSGSQLVEGNAVAFEREMTGTNTGMWGDGTAPSGRHVVLHGMSVFEVDNGKIVYQADYFGRPGG